MARPKTTDETAPRPTDSTILELYVAAGGRCSFYGCPASVLREPLTSLKARLGNVAHIVAESRGGPRGDDPLPMSQRSEIGNLMLMCTAHHDFIDKKEHVVTYTVALLREFKQRHEDHVARMTALPFVAKTHGVRLVGHVRRQLVRISDAEINAAVFAHENRYVAGILDVDLGKVADTDDSAYWNTAAQKVDDVLDRQILPQIEDGTIERISFFGLARIPLLSRFGRRIGDKVPLTYYHFHKQGSDGWHWPTTEACVDFEIVPHGTDASEGVAVLAAVSGGSVERVREHTKAKLIYEIRPRNTRPSRTVLRSPDTLGRFRATYQQFLSMFEALHPTVDKLDCFLAVPPALAVMWGRDVLPEVTPDLVIHDICGGRYQPVYTLGRKSA